MTEEEMRAALAPMIELLQTATPGDAIAVLRASGDGACNFYVGASDLGVVAAFAQVLLEQVTKAIAAVSPDQRSPKATALAGQALLALAALSGPGGAQLEPLSGQDNALLLASPAGNA